MTERKPPGMKFETWIEKQIREAEDRGAFENLRGAGKPIPGLGGPQEEQWWVKNYIRREQLDIDPLLPTPVLLRKEIERLPETVRKLRTEQQVRDTVADLNQRIMDWWRDGTGPQIHVGRVNADRVVEQWLTDRPAPVQAPVQDGSGDPRAEPTSWWRRLLKRDPKRSPERG
jgi:hypothetical protein